MSRAVRALLVAVVVTGVVIAGVVLGSPDDPSGPADDGPVASEPTATPLADRDTRSVAVDRAAFCDAVPAEVVEQALGAAPDVKRSWADGERTLLAPGVRDIAHEFGCAWSGQKVTAAAWVFAPPVTLQRARELATAAGRGKGCRPLDDAPAFGRSTTAVYCAEGARTPQLSYRGLFGDAWLTCALSVPGSRPDQALLDRTGDLCVAVLEAARA